MCVVCSSVHYKLQCTVDRVSLGEIYRVAFLVETKYQIYLHKYKIALKKFLYCKSWKAHQVFSEKLKFFTNTTNETHLKVRTVSRKRKTDLMFDLMVLYIVQVRKLLFSLMIFISFR